MSGELRAERQEDRRRPQEKARVFRFENLDIWKRAADIAVKLYEIADHIERGRRFRFAEQLRAAALSMPKNIADGSGSTPQREFMNFLNMARRSTFENASMLMLFGRQRLVSREDVSALLSELDELCRMITAFSRSLDRS